MTSIDLGTGRDLITAVEEFAATPRLTSAAISVIHDRELLGEDRLPGAPALDRAQPRAPARDNFHGRDAPPEARP